MFVSIFRLCIYVKHIEILNKFEMRSIKTSYYYYYYSA